MEKFYKKKFFGSRLFSALIACLFMFNVVIVPQEVYAQSAVLNLPLPGTMVTTTSSFAPAMIKGINLYPENPLKFDFIIDRGDATLNDNKFNSEPIKLIKYFLASLTVPEDQMWVNLSPYEKNRIIPDVFGKTEMGRDLLAQDYILKQLTASLMNPDDKLGGEFWQRVYSKAQEKYGTTDIPMNTFNKIWIVPEQASVYEHEKGAFIVKSHLKVMLEEDYLALESNKNSTKHGLGDIQSEDLQVISGVSSEVIREILIPEIEKEVNEGKTFTDLRQIYNAVILANWYKQNLKESLLGQIYVDQGKTDGIEVTDKTINQKIYEQYLEAFRKGIYNFIKEDYDPQSQTLIPRKYFSGGVNLDHAMVAKAPEPDVWEAVNKVKDGTVVTWQADSAVLTRRQFIIGATAALLVGTNQKAGAIESDDQQLIQDLNDPDWQKQKNAAQELFRRQNQEGINRAQEILVWPRITKMSRSIEYLGSDGKQLIELGEIAVQPLIENLKNQNSNTDTRKWSAYILGIIGNFEQVFPVLEHVFTVESYYASLPEDHYRALKQETARGLRGLFERQSLETLLQTLKKTKSPDVIAELVRTLEKFPVDNTIKALIPFLKYDNDDVSKNALYAANQIIAQNNELSSLLPTKLLKELLTFYSKNKAISSYIGDSHSEAAWLLASLYSISENKDESIVGAIIARAQSKQPYTHSMYKQVYYLASQRSDIAQKYVDENMASIKSTKPEHPYLNQKSGQDPAMLGQQQKAVLDSVGGIDLNSNEIKMEIQRNGNGLIVPILKEPVSEFENINGFSPVIINVAPITNLPSLLGLSQSNGDKQLSQL